MPRPYRRPDKSIQMRSGNGRFRKSTLRDLGVEPAARDGATCLGCGHHWHPLVVSGTCPECGDWRKAGVHSEDGGQAGGESAEAIKAALSGPFIDPLAFNLARRLGWKQNTYARRGEPRMIPQHEEGTPNPDPDPRSNLQRFIEDAAQREE